LQRKILKQKLKKLNTASAIMHTKKNAKSDNKKVIIAAPEADAP
jgi:hypothetical protein